MTFSMFACFMEAMETMNFTTAAQNSHINQPAFSRNIAALEKKLGFALFTRSKQNGVRPTQAGENFYKGILEIKTELEQLIDESARISRGEEGKLVIGLLGGVCTDSLTMQVIQTFMEHYPGVETQLICCQLHEMVQAVKQGRIDTCLVLSNAMKEHGELCYADIVDVENYLGVPARLHCDTNVEHSLKEFEDEVFLLSEDAPELNKLLIAACRSAGFEPKTKMAPDFETKMLWIEFGYGISVNSKEHYIKDSPYVDFVKVREIGADSYAVIWRQDNTNPAIQLFASLFNEICHK